MSDVIANFHFLRPWWLLALAALPVLWRALAQRGADAGAWRGAVDAHLLRHLLVAGDDTTPNRLPRRLLIAGWTVACLALAGPAWERLPQPLYQNRAARVIAIELSASMLAQDVKPSRYERARYKLDDMLKRSGDAQTALIAYAGDAFVVAPLTDDANTVVNLVDALDPSIMPVAGNATGRAIDLGIKLVKQAGVDDAEIILLADAVSDDAIAAAQRARAAGIRLSVLGIGSAQGAPVPLPQGGFLKNPAGEIMLPRLDTAALAALAKAGGGRYATYTTDADDLDKLLDTLAERDPAQSKATQAATPRFLDRGPWLVLFLLPMGLLASRRGWVMLLPLMLFAHGKSALAFTWSDLWQRPDQRAQAELDAGHAAQAQALAQSPDLRGAAAYRAGDFATAQQAFGSADSAEAQYNLGNALAKQGHYPEAIAAYAAALKKAPDMADAAANKQAIEEWLKKQQAQKQDQQKQQDAKDHQGREQQQDGSGSASGEKSAEKSEDKRQSGKDQQQDQQSGHDPKQDKDGQAQSEPQDGANNDASQQASSNAQDQAGEDKNAQPRSAGSEADKEADKRAQQEFQQKMDQALNNGNQQPQPKPALQAKPVRLGAKDDGSPQNEQQQAVEQWIERVPDDPGGLLRRKFQLEYQRRQNGQGGGG